MRLGIVRQRYTPFGGAERFVERAIDTLIGRGVHVRVYTRSWPAERAGQVEPVICNPYFIGGVWRDAGFARAVREALARDRPDLVQTHERIAGCDIFRAGDGVHRAWLAERLRAGSVPDRIAIAANPHHRYTLAAEARVFADPSLRAVICISQMVRDDIRRHFALPDEKLHVIYNAVDSRAFNPGVREGRAVTRSRLGFLDSHVVFALVGSGYARKGVPIALRALARLPERARLIVVGRDKHAARYEAPRAPRGRARACRVRRPPGGSAAVPGRGGRVRPAHALRSAVERGAGGARVRSARRDEPPLRRGRARRRARRRLDLRRRRHCRAGCALGAAAGRQRAGAASPRGQ